MRKIKLIVVLCAMFMMAFLSTSVYAAENNTSYNIEAKTADKDGKTVEYLISNDGYLRITQIIQNSQNVKINTSTFDNKLLLSGKVSKGTELTIKIFNDSNGEEPTDTFEISVGATEVFSQAAEVKEGNNTIIINYSNKNDGVKDYVTFFVNRGAAQDMEAIKSYLVIPKI